ncbi:calcium-binding protein [Massilia sp. CF038]|uniref:calcium-binding protein n=1 Tax=Massilia sp. CF038 TaxID=1881045 RepID=UPI001E2F9104|nr:calcium-binding protein [Massilia sp. CF038]
MASGVEQFRFSDGTNWDFASILGRVAPVAVLGEGDDVYGGGSASGLGGDDRLFDSWTDDVLDGGAGNDVLTAREGNDVLIGGAGNDILEGGTGANLFKFAPGWGQDVILTRDQGWSSSSTRIDLTFVAAGSVTVSRSDNGTGSDLIIALKGSTDSITVRDYFYSGGGVIVSNLSIGFASNVNWSREQIDLALFMPPGLTLTGTDANDFLVGQWGNDTLAGGDSFDTLIGNEGNDLLDGGNGSDSMEGGAGDDVLLGGDGLDQLRGGDGDDLLDGGSGDDFLDGEAGNNTIIFGRNSGRDELMVRPDGMQTIRMDADVKPSDVRIEGNGYDMWVFIKGTTAQLRIPCRQAPQDIGSGMYMRSFAEIRFADGTTWDDAMLQRLGLTGDEQDQQITGTETDDWMDGRAGNDYLDGRDGNDELRGGEGNDQLSGGRGNDLLIGGEGNDQLSGYEGNDVLRGGRGDDRLFGEDGANTYLFGKGDGNDIIGFDSLDTVLFDADIAPGTVVVRENPEYAGSVDLYYEGGRITTGARLSGDSNDHRTVRFADGTIWDANELLRRSTLGDDNANEIQGSSRSEVLDGQGGNDTLKGNGGHDTLRGGAGDDFLDGGDGNDTIIGGAGNDFISAQDGGDDVYVFNRGDGADTIAFAPFWWSGQEQIRFGDGIARADVRLSANGSTLTINYGAGDTIRVENYQVDGYADRRITQIRFADGNSYTVDQLINSAPVLVIPVPFLVAKEGTNFEFKLPPGSFVDPDQGDTLHYELVAPFGGQAPAWLTVDAYTGTLSGTPGYSDASYRGMILRATDSRGKSAESFFELMVEDMPPPGITLNGSAAADTLVGTWGSDTINGLAGDDVLDGGLGADTLVGGTGNDSYYVDDQGDVVVEAGGGGNDIVYASVRQTLSANVERLTLTGHGAIYGIGNNLNNILTGNAAANFLDGRAGADTMTGGTGDDTYIVDNGSDIVTEAAGEGTDRIYSSVGRTLGNNQEILTLYGTGAIAGAGNSLNNLLQGNDAVNTLQGNDGYDILQGFGGNDNLTDSSLQGNVFDGGAGADRLSGSNGADMYFGGADNDQLSVGNGADLIAFNRGDGQDTVTSVAGTDNTVSLGHGILYADLALSKSGNDLVLNVGAGEQIAFTNWYAGAGRSVGTLQVVTEGGADYVAGSASAIHDNRIEQFNFSALVSRFDQLRLADKTMTSWNIAGALEQFSSGGSNGAGIGGEFAYRYAIDGSLTDATTLAGLAAVPQPQLAGTTIGAPSTSGQRETYKML